MSNAACVGGVLWNGQMVRLLNEQGYNQPINTELNVGDIYEINYEPVAHCIPPHVEDIRAQNFRFIQNCPAPVLEKYLRDKAKKRTYFGHPNQLFEGLLQWTGAGSGYISKSHGLPERSVGFWIPDKDLIRNDYDQKVRYEYSSRCAYTVGAIPRYIISYVGYQSPIDIIPAGTIVRVSLARWWSPNGEEERCYLQLSGWYGEHEKPCCTSNSNSEDDDDDDLPF